MDRNNAAECRKRLQSLINTGTQVHRQKLERELTEICYWLYEAHVQRLQENAALLERIEELEGERRAAHFRLAPVPECPGQLTLAEVLK